MTPLWAIVGATGSGKTRLAVELCEAIGGEIVSVDSAQIFIGLDIGTAKPSPDEQRRAPHHLIDCVEPDTQWSAAGFASAADLAIDDIRSRGKVPVLCGGAGLWYRALVRGVFEAPPIASDIRQRVRDDLETLGAPAVHTQLAAVDPLAAERLHPNDGQRVGRALEVFRQTGTPISTLQDAHGFASARHDVRALAFDWPRPALIERLNQRAVAMFDAGLIAEVQALLDRGVPPSGPGLSCIGYREVVAHLAGELSCDEALAAIQVATRRYAKRQRNWFRSEPNVQWIAPTTPTADALTTLQTQ